MKKTQWKDAIRDIRKTFVSWIAIVTVTMIGCGVCFGVTFYADSLAEKGERFFDETRYEDFMLLAPRGLSAEEIDRLKTADGVEDAEGGHMLTGAKIHFGNRVEDTVLCTLTAIVSQPRLMSGRLPSAENECALPDAFMRSRGIRIGDAIRLTMHSAAVPAGFVRNEAFTVTGAVEHGDCICTEYDSYVYVPIGALNTSLALNRFTCIRIDAALPEGEGHLSDSYPQSMLPVRLALEAKLEEIAGDQSPMFRAGFGLLDRGAKEGFVTFRTDIRIVRILALIFAVLFLLIGAVVTASTLTILIDNRRKQLGTMRAYGFTVPEITLRFLLYGSSAVLTGLLLSLVLAAGLQSFIRSVIGDLFLVKPEGFAFYPTLFFILLAAQLLLCCAVSVLVTFLRVSRFSAVDLMSGAMPDGRMQTESGEHPAGSLYSRLILRNMRMDRSRILTSVAVIAGSCLLIGIGITLKDSLDDAMPRSAREIRHYDLEIRLPDSAQDAERAEVAAYLAELKAESVWIHQKNAVYQAGDTREYASVLSGPDSLYPDYLELRDPSGKLLTPSGGMTVIADLRLSERLNLREGDLLSLFDDGFRPFEASVPRRRCFRAGFRRFRSLPDGAGAP